MEQDQHSPKASADVLAGPEDERVHFVVVGLVAVALEHELFLAVDEDLSFPEQADHHAAGDVLRVPEVDCGEQCDEADWERARAEEFVGDEVTGV